MSGLFSQRPVPQKNPFHSGVAFHLPHFYIVVQCLFTCLTIDHLTIYKHGVPTGTLSRACHSFYVSILLRTSNDLCHGFCFLGSACPSKRDCVKKQNQAAHKRLTHFNLLYLPVSPPRYPDRSATLSPPPCQTANFDADGLPVSPCPESSWRGCAAPKSASASTGHPLQTWPAGGRMVRCGSVAGEGWSWREVHFDS